MKKLIVVGLLAISSLAATAATVKTSKATPLSTSQMESIKGAGVIVVMNWQPTGEGYYDSYGIWHGVFGYVIVGQYSTGPSGPSGTYYTGGPGGSYWDIH